MCHVWRTTAATWGTKGTITSRLWPLATPCDARPVLAFSVGRSRSPLAHAIRGGAHSGLARCIEIAVRSRVAALLLVTALRGAVAREMRGLINACVRHGTIGRESIRWCGDPRTATKWSHQEVACGQQLNTYIGSSTGLERVVSTHTSTTA